MLVVVGGHSRNIGKTSVVEGLIRELRHYNWSALKITQYGNGVCDHHCGSCSCEPESGEPVALTEEYAANGSDSGRFLAAGAARSLWLRVPAGRLAQAAGLVRKVAAQSANTIIESNSVMEFVQPDLFLMMLDFGCPDFKQSSLRYCGLADGFVIHTAGNEAPAWDPALPVPWTQRPNFRVTPPVYVTPTLVEFVNSKFSEPSRR
jgi:hypothetical protein